MGQKVHPTGIRLGISKDWNAKWYAGNNEYAGLLNSDLKIREFIKGRHRDAAVRRPLINSRVLR